MSSISTKQDLICVTGASGYIAGYIIQILLEKGHRVRGIVRDLKKEEKYAFLKKFPQKDGQLEFVQGDLESGDFATLFQGCDGVIHTATPYMYTAKDPQKEIVDPAVNGTVNAIKGAIKAGVKRIVITSSGGAVLHFPVDNGYKFSDKDWNNWSSLSNNPYFFSKKLAEEAAWNLYKENPKAIDLVVVNPLYVLGPAQTPVLNSSLTLLKNLLTGEAKQTLPGFVGVVDVRDVATAHVIALEHPQAVGKRLLAWAETRSWKAIPAELRKSFPKFPVFPDDGSAVEPATWGIDTTPLQALGWKATHKFEDTIQDTVKSFLHLGIVTEPK